MIRRLSPILAIIVLPTLCNAADIHSSIVDALNTKIRLIAIDPGFGGVRTGPSGHCGSVYAKDINLQIALKVAERIRTVLGIDVMLTREKDVYLPLEERSTSANMRGADIFISISANGSESTSASGIETYCLNLETEPDAIRIAARQNSTGDKNLADMEAILTDLMRNSTFSESSRLADSVQSCLYNRLKTHHGGLKNRGSKRAPFYVLLGAEMPAIVINPGFMTNTTECKLLSTREYQDAISAGIVEGIRTYIKEMTTQHPPSADH